MASITLSVLRCPDQVVPGQRQSSGGEISMGRGADCDWPLDDPDRVLSKKHCVVEFYAGGWQLRDLSTNGTFVNHESEPVGRDQARALLDGDRIRLGTYEIEVRIEQAAAAPGWGAPAAGGAAPFAAAAAGSFGGFEPGPFGGPPDGQGGIGGTGIGGGGLLPLGEDFASDLGGTMPDHAPATAGMMPQVVPVPTGGGLIPMDWNLEADFAAPPAVPPTPPPVMPPMAAPMPQAPMPQAPMPQAPMPQAPLVPVAMPPVMPPAAVPAMAPPAMPPAELPALDVPNPFAAPAGVPVPHPPSAAPLPAAWPETAPASANPFLEADDVPPARPPHAVPPVAVPVPPVAAPAHAAAPPPPVAAPVAAPVAPATAPPAAVPTAGLVALLAGAGVPQAMAVRAAADPEATLKVAGEMLRAAVAGLRALLIARADVKREFRIEQTMLRAAGNNPVKFAATEEQALAAMLEQRAAGLASLQETVDDLTAHQVATLAATQAAARALLDRLAPGPIEADDTGGGLLPGAKEKRLWEAYKKRHAQLVEQFEDDFDSAFGKAFARAYEQATGQRRR